MRNTATMREKRLLITVTYRFKVVADVYAYVWVTDYSMFEKCDCVCVCVCVCVCAWVTGYNLRLEKILACHFVA